MKKLELFDYVKNKCKMYDEQFQNKTNFWVTHVFPVIKTAQELSKEFSSIDNDVIEIAALLHDIACVENYTMNWANHHEIGVMIAEELIGNDLPQSKVLAIQDCIKTHRGSVKSLDRSNEAVIISDADAIVHFQTVSQIVEWRMALGEQSLVAIDYTLRKIDNSFDKMSMQNQKKFENLYFSAKKELLKRRFSFQKGFVSSIIDNVKCNPIVECGCD